MSPPAAPIPFPSSGAEREIFLRALRDYSDACEPPQLTPACPYSVDLPDGSRICEEECIDLIARFGAPASRDDIDLGGGLSVVRRRRPRARHGPAERSLAYDARRINLNDEGRPMESWHTTSLLVRLRDDLLSVPARDPERAKERKERIHQSIAILGSRGYDFEKHLRAGTMSRLGTAMAALLTFAPEGVVDGQATLWDEWEPIVGDLRRTTLLTESTELSEEEVEGFLELAARLQTWVATADLEEVLDWRPPSDGLPVPDVALNEGMRSSDRWIVDRFTETYLEEWATSSLHSEWKWLHGELNSPISETEMKQRRVEASRLAMIIADRAAAGTRQSSIAMGSFQNIAAGLLKAGKRDLAASVFNTVLRVEPDNAWAHNNRGFCLIEHDAERALASLERARSLDYKPALVNTANRALCMFRLGRLTAALETADRGYDTAVLEEDTPALLWVPTPPGDDGPHLREVTDLRSYFADLGRAIAIEADDPVSVQIWEARVAESPDSPQAYDGEKSAAS